MTHAVDDVDPSADTAGDPEVWYCRECAEYRPVDGEHGFACDAPRDCPRSGEWDGDNCGYIVCAECHEPMSDRHLAPGVTTE